jgi:hypothetical protein
LKKQSQFARAQICASSFMKGLYDKIPLCGAQKNKAKQSQFMLQIAYQPDSVEII